jgi:hypothetical protein
MAAMFHRPQEFCRALRLAGLTTLLLVSGLFARAELGGNVSSVQADEVRLQGTRQVTEANGFTVHEISTPVGATVREYVSPGGSVFGISWEGPWLPDMRQLLGAYYEQYAQAVQKKTVRRGPLLIEEPGLVVEMGGHARSFFGRAYLPQAMPRGVQADVVR